MIFQIRRSNSDPETNVRPCEEARMENIFYINGDMNRPRYIWEVEIHSLNDLLTLLRKYERLVLVSKDTTTFSLTEFEKGEFIENLDILEIYDENRE